MPDLSHDAAREYWSEYPDPMIYRVVTFMESVEKWTLDGNEGLEEAIKQLGDALDDLADIDLSELGHEQAMIQLACNIKASRSLRLLQAIDSEQPGSASKLLVYAEETSESNEDTAGLFLRKNIVFERLRLLSRVFSEERFQLVTHALEGED